VQRAGSLTLPPATAKKAQAITRPSILVQYYNDNSRKLGNRKRTGEKKQYFSVADVSRYHINYYSILLKKDINISITIMLV
jgi:hypothetical protein